MPAGANQCKGKRKDGEPCGMAPMRGMDYCYVHVPGIDAIRKTNWSKGGKAPRSVQRTHGVHTRKRRGRPPKVPVVGRQVAGIGMHRESPSQSLPKLRTRDDVSAYLEQTALEVEGLENDAARVTCRLKLLEIAMRHTDTRVLDEWRKKLDRMEKKLKAAQRPGGQPRVVA